LGTLAHVAVLEKAKVLTGAETSKLRTALADLHANASALPLSGDLEDVHMNVEAVLTERVGDLGKKVHTARSRNDQVALDLRLWSRRQTIALGLEVHHLAGNLLALAREHPDTILPGHTHFQVAQPVLLSHTLAAHAARLARDLDRLHDAYARLNISPLGAGALAGTSHPIDPTVAAKLLGFDAAFTNSLDAVSDRDFVHELLAALAITLNHVSGLAEELILFTHPAFGFATVDDAHATGSSLMPNKKNPDVLEIARAKAATALGALAASLAHTKALPLAYNRDLQEQKRLLLDTLPIGPATVRVVADLVETLSFDKAAMRRAAAAGHADATELADYLVRKGVPFRDAHGVAGAAVHLATERRLSLAELPLKELQRLHPKVGADVAAVLGPEATVAAKSSPGGTSPRAAARALKLVEADVNGRAAFFYQTATALQRTEAALTTPARSAR
jgi:argininosuccinate lyase